MCDISDQDNRRACFSRNLTMSVKQVRIASDPVFGDTQDTPPVKGAIRSKSQVKPQFKRNRFATYMSVTDESETDICNKLQKSYLLYKDKPYYLPVLYSWSCTGAVSTTRNKSTQGKAGLSKGERSVFRLLVHRALKQELQQAHYLQILQLNSSQCFAY